MRFKHAHSEPGSHKHEGRISMDERVADTTAVHMLSVSGPESVRGTATGSGHGEKRFSVDIVDAMRVIQNFHTRAQTQASTRARL